MQESVVVMVSGGLDSAALLRHYLRETDWTVHAHHVSLRNVQEPRWQPEDVSCRQVVEWLQERERPFAYKESVLEWPYEHHIGWDSDLFLWLAARIVPNVIGDRVRLALGWVDEDRAPPDAWERQKRGVADRIWDAAIYSMGEIDRDRVVRELERPFYDLRKVDVMGMIPRELLELTWSCRTPNTHGGEGSATMFVPCGRCHACRARYRAMEEYDAKHRAGTDETPDGPGRGEDPGSEPDGLHAVRLR